MKAKTVCKIIVDIAMTILLLLQMAHQGVGDFAHEWIGVGMFGLFVLHNILNLKWYKNLFRGRYTAFRVLQTALVFLVLAAMTGLMVSGVMLSRHVFVSLPISGGMSFARSLHMLSSHWGYLFMALHLGLHWGMLMGMARKAAGITAPSKGRTVVARTVAALIAAYGVYALMKRDFFLYALLINPFTFWDYGEPIVYFFADYLAIMGLCVFTAYYGAKLLQKNTSGKKAKEEIK